MRLASHGECADVTPELTVYRYSEDKMMEYLRAKVSRLSKAAVAEKSRTIIRNLAKDGMMDDGKEDLLQRRNPVWTPCCRYPELTACFPAVGHIRAACNLISQYVTQDLYSALTAKYEYV
jgi:ribonuclease H2 subunit B